MSEFTKEELHFISHYLYLMAGIQLMELKEGNCFPVMGCRSALSPWKDENGNYKFYGRLTMLGCH